MKIRDIMRPGPFTIMSTDTLGNAQRAMTRAHIRHLPVMSEGKLIGMLSERDVLAARAHAADDQLWWKIPVLRAMQSQVQTAGPDDSLSELAGRMAAGKFGAMPIVERGKLIGIVTTSDVLAGEVRQSMGPSSAATAIVADAMTAYPFTIAPDALVLEAAVTMADRRVRHLPVVDATGTIVGMLSERDVRGAIGDPLLYVETRKRRTDQPRVREAMTKPAVAIVFDQPLVAAAQLFADERIGAVPVLDSFGALIGILSYVDVLHLLAA